MAMMHPTPRDVSESIDDLSFDEIVPVWPDIAALDPRVIRFRYDRLSDTLLVHFYGKARDSFSHELRDGFYLLLDPTSLEVVGFQLEDFLQNAVKQHPPLMVALDVAEVRGITYDEIRTIYREITPLKERIRNVVWPEHPSAKKARIFRSFKRNPNDMNGMLWAS
jgi:hypothetical protein